MPPWWESPGTYKDALERFSYDYLPTLKPGTQNFDTAPASSRGSAQTRQAACTGCSAGPARFDIGQSLKAYL